MEQIYSAVPNMNQFYTKRRGTQQMIASKTSSKKQSRGSNLPIGGGTHSSTLDYNNFGPSTAAGTAPPKSPQYIIGSSREGEVGEIMLIDWVDCLNIYGNHNFQFVANYNNSNMI